MNETASDREVRMAFEDCFEVWRKLVPDSRLNNRSITISSPMGELQPIFCINCGRPNGAVTTGPELPEVTFICPPCAERHGGLPVPEVPENLINARRRE